MGAVPNALLNLGRGVVYLLPFGVIELLIFLCYVVCLLYFVTLMFLQTGVNPSMLV